MLSNKLYALDCTRAYDQWFGGKTYENMTPAERAEAQSGYEAACRYAHEYRFGQSRRKDNGR